METHISANGGSQRPLAMVSICGKMETGTKANGRIALSMAKDRTSSLTETASPALTLWANPKVKASTSGRMVAFISVSLKMVSSTAKVNGRRDLTTKSATCMKDSTQWIRKTEWECSPGRVATSTKAVTRMTKGTVTERCTGKMALATRVNGIKEFKMALEEWSFQMVASRKVYLKITHSKALK